MSVTKRGQVFYLTFRPFGKLVYLRTAARTKTEAKQVEMALLLACKSGDYRSLEIVSREACVRLFRNQGLELPSDLNGNEPEKELTLWEAVQLFLRYPSIKNCAAKKRYGYCLANLVERLGMDTPIKKLWVPDLRMYQTDRLAEDAAPGTVNRELSTLSKLFTVMTELKLVESNPVRLIKRLPPGHREVYISFKDFLRIVDVCPPWYRPIVQTAFYTGMRRGEILGLTRRQVNLATRIIRLGEENTKERRAKRIPIHAALVPVLEQCLKVTSLESDRVFLLNDKTGIRPVSLEGTKNPWRRQIPKLGLDPAPRFHDLRHTWKTNARRSGMDLEIRESILGHWLKEKTVTEGYGRISDAELVQAIDAMTFDHGDTEIWASRQKMLAKCKQKRSKKKNQDRAPERKILMSL